VCVPTPSYAFGGRGAGSAYGDYAVASGGVRQKSPVYAGRIATKFFPLAPGIRLDHVIAA
jgi:hypothetical protein